MKKSHRFEPKHRYGALAALLLATALPSQASAKDVPGTPLTMTVISDNAFGRTVTEGKYEQAIDRITRNGRRIPKRFADQTNLCVAYTKTYEIEKARIACDAAISFVEQRGARAWRGTWYESAAVRAYQSDLAVALSNRGVLLAATGDADLAERDFVAAIELETALTSTVENNLERLGQLTIS